MQIYEVQHGEAQLVKEVDTMQSGFLVISFKQYGVNDLFEFSSQMYVSRKVVFSCLHSNMQHTKTHDRF